MMPINLFEGSNASPNNPRANHMIPSIRTIFGDLRFAESSVVSLIVPPAFGVNGDCCAAVYTSIRIPFVRLSTSRSLFSSLFVSHLPMPVFACQSTSAQPLNQTHEALFPSCPCPTRHSLLFATPWYQARFRRCPRNSHRSRTTKCQKTRSDPGGDPGDLPAGKRPPVHPNEI